MRQSKSQAVITIFLGILFFWLFSAVIGDGPVDAPLPIAYYKTVKALRLGANCILMCTALDIRGIWYRLRTPHTKQAHMRLSIIQTVLVYCALILPLAILDIVFVRQTIGGILMIAKGIDMSIKCITRDIRYYACIHAE